MPSHTEDSQSIPSERTDWRKGADRKKKTSLGRQPQPGQGQRQLLRFSFCLTELVVLPKLFHFSRKSGSQMHHTTLQKFLLKVTLSEGWPFPSFLCHFPSL